MRKAGIAIFLLFLLVLALVYRQVDMAVTLDHRDKQAEFYKAQRDEAVAMLDRVLQGVPSTKIGVVSDPMLLKDFKKESGSTLIIGSLRYDFRDGRCSRVSVEE